MVRSVGLDQRNQQSRRVVGFRYTPARMKPWYAIGVGAIGAIFFCCASTESVIAPLGFGPLAKAELAEREFSNAQAKPPEKPKPRRAAKSSPWPYSSTNMSAHAASSDKSTSHDAGAADASVFAVMDASVPTKVSDWLGLWRGKDTTQFQIPSFPPEPMVDEKARIRVEPSGSKDIKFVLIDSSTDHDLCSLVAKLEFNQAKIDPGQPCFGSEDESASLSIRVRTGSATLVEARLTVEIALDAEIQSDQYQMTGSVQYHFEGKQ